jgi:(1->4)-alpha-D-glucan 1-alpha-D-glucosylmutase
MAEPRTPDQRAPRAPVSTYRLQVTPDFGLHEAARRLPYLHDLGIDWVYLSPVLAAEPGSEHGYDVVAHDRIDPSRGGADGLAAVSEEARRLGMGVLVDIVPNHVGVATPAQSAWWWELLRDGPASPGARRFDVDWDANDGRILVPIVGDDDLRDDGTIAHLTVQGELLCYHDHRFPIAPGTDGGSPDEVHAAQHYELAGWRRADDELNYRRFFTINTLAAIRVEDPEVFAESHAEI